MLYHHRLKCDDPVPSHLLLDLNMDARVDEEQDESRKERNGAAVSLQVEILIVVTVSYKSARCHRLPQNLQEKHRSCARDRDPLVHTDTYLNLAQTAPREDQEIEKKNGKCRRAINGINKL